MFYWSSLKMLILFSQTESWYLLSSCTHFAPAPTQKMILRILGKWKLSDVTSLFLSVHGLSIPHKTQFNFLSRKKKKSHQSSTCPVSFLIHLPSPCLLYAPVVSCSSCDCCKLQSLFPPQGVGICRSLFAKLTLGSLHSFSPLAFQSLLPGLLLRGAVVSCFLN